MAPTDDPKRHALSFVDQSPNPGTARDPHLGVDKDGAVQVRPSLPKRSENSSGKSARCVLFKNESFARKCFSSLCQLSTHLGWDAGADTAVAIEARDVACLGARSALPPAVGGRPASISFFADGEAQSRIRRKIWLHPLLAGGNTRSTHPLLCIPPFQDPQRNFPLPALRPPDRSR